MTRNIIAGIEVLGILGLTSLTACRSEDIGAVRDVVAVAEEPLDVTLTVTFDTTTNAWSITGGDDGGEDVSVHYGMGHEIHWVRAEGSGEWYFMDIRFDRDAPCFSSIDVQPTKISIIDDNQNAGPEDDEFKYTIHVWDASEQKEYELDPKVINRAGSHRAMRD